MNIYNDEQEFTRSTRSRCLKGFMKRASSKSMYTSNQLRETGNGRKGLYFEHIPVWHMEDTLTCKLFDQYYIRDELEVERDSFLEKAFDHKKAIAHE